MNKESKIEKVRIYCHCCHGKGTIEEEAYPSRKKIQVICPECNGTKWVITEATIMEDIE